MHEVEQDQNGFRCRDGDRDHNIYQGIRDLGRGDSQNQQYNEYGEHHVVRFRGNSMIGKLAHRHPIK